MRCGSWFGWSGWLVLALAAGCGPGVAPPKAEVQVGQTRSVLAHCEQVQRAGALVQRLTRFWPALWAPPESTVEVCSGYLRQLAEAARRAQTERARLFVFELLDRRPAP
jgi:hypothetical protein